MPPSPSTLGRAAEPPLDPETALPWQKLAAAIADVLRVEPPDAPPPGRDPHEARVERVAEMLARKGLLDPAEIARRMASLEERLAHDKDAPAPKARFSSAGPNDIGGMPGGPIDRSEHDIEDWERLVVALGGVLGAHGILNLHERRRAVEALGDDYNRLAYFERMVAGQFTLLVEKGILTAAEVDRKIARMRGGT